MPDALLMQQYETAMQLVGSGNSIQTSLSKPECVVLDIIIDSSERAKGVMTVVVTSLVYKILHPDQDIRNHQDGIPNGYAGRGFDQKYITPFLKKCKFPAMAESGWLTRSLEQKSPYTMNYSGAITPKSLKQAFLTTLDNIQNGANPVEYLSYIFQGLIIKRGNYIAIGTKDFLKNTSKT